MIVAEKIEVGKGKLGNPFRQLLKEGVEREALEQVKLCSFWIFWEHNFCIFVE